MPRRSSTKNLIKAMHILAMDSLGEDVSAHATILEAAQRLKELHDLLHAAAGPSSHGRWDSDFRIGVERVLR